MRALACGALLLCLSSAVTGCSSGGNNTPLAPVSGASPTATPVSGPTATPAPTPTPTPVATATPTPTPSNGTSTTSLNNGAPISNAPLTVPVPAPTGYSQSLSVSLVSAPAKSSITTTSGTSAPAGLVPLSVARSLFARRSPQSSSFSTIFYTSVQPSANITVAGNVSYTASFPSGGLVAGTNYYLAFYDTTQSSPSWQTISGPVTPNGANLTFSGSISSFTLIAGKLYGFAIFSQATPTATPPPAPQTLLYYGNDNGLTIANESGTVVNTLAIPSESFDLDDAGNVYAYYAHSGGTSPTQGGTPLLAEFPAGSATKSATYLPTTTPVAGEFVAASGAGELVAVHNVGSNGVLTTDVWDPGVTGAPSRTINTSDPSEIVDFALTHDGTLYLPDRSSTGAPQFDVIPPGSSAAASVIPETIVPASQYNNFAPNYSAVGPDGTMYVTEYSFVQPDPNAGLYIYPLNGPERFIATATNAQGSGPQGVDVDSSGNIYVVNNNSGFTSNTTCQGDTLGSVSVFSQSGTLQRTITGGFNSGFPITTAADGTSFLSTFQVQFTSSCAVTGQNAIYSIAPGASTATQISSSGSTEIVLYDGTHKTEPFSRHYGGASSARGAMLIRRRPGR